MSARGTLQTLMLKSEHVRFLGVKRTRFSFRC